MPFVYFQKSVLDSSLGFAAGVMIAASYWSLLAPAVELAEESKNYGENGEYAWCPVSLGFILGALFVLGADVFISSFGISNPEMILGMPWTIVTLLIIFIIFTLIEQVNVT